MIRFEKYGFLIMVLLAASIIVIPTYYITGDGPSHTYNAKVWFDYLFNHNRAFYKPFYQLNRNIEPNLISHILLGTLTQFVKPYMADKIFQVIYVFVFAYGFRFLIKAIREENAFLSYLFFPFLFSLPFQQGFYNYCIAIGFMCWTLGYFIRNYDGLQEVKKIFILFTLLMFTILSHGMITAYTLMLMLLIWIYFRFNLLMKGEIKTLWYDVLSLILITTPVLIILLGFIFRTGLDIVPHAETFSQKLWSFMQLTTLQSTKKLEMYPSIFFGILILVSFLYQCTQFKWWSKIGIVFLMIVAYTFYAYISAPHSIGGAGSIDIRLGFLPFLFLVFVLAAGNWTEFLQKIIMTLSFLLLGVFLFIRFPAVLKASDIAEDMMQSSKYVKDNSVVLNLHFDDAHALNDTDVLFERDASFIHLTDYIGAEKKKHVIMINNYEADIQYFPINWRDGKSPRTIIPNMLPGHYLPCGDYKYYEMKTTTNIDYILFQNWNKKYLSNECVFKMREVIDNQFDLVFKSPHNYLLLLERRITDTSTMNKIY